MQSTRKHIMCNWQPKLNCLFRSGGVGDGRRRCTYALIQKLQITRNPIIFVVLSRRTRTRRDRLAFVTICRRLDGCGLVESEPLRVHEFYGPFSCSQLHHIGQLTVRFASPSSYLQLLFAHISPHLLAHHKLFSSPSMPTSSLY